MSTSLKRTGKFQYSGYLAAKAEPTGWNKDTLLLQFVEESGACSVFVLTDGAKESFQQCECHRIYDVEISGRCVRNCDGLVKHGVKTQYEVIMKFACAVVLSKTAWPFRFVYTFQSWETLNQVAEGTCLDLIGEVLVSPVRDLGTSLSKLVVQLGNGDMQQQVELLGTHANLTIAAGDRVSISGLRMKVWNHERSLQTNYLSLVEVNVKLETEELEKVFEKTTDGPKRKILRLTPATAATVAELKSLGEKLLRDAQSAQTSDLAEFGVTGKLLVLSNNFFQLDAPILDTAKGPVICWRTILEDATGRVDVKVWDRACHALFKITADRLQELWEESHEDPSRQPKILEYLNTLIDVKVICLCKPEVWSNGKKEKTHTLQINVNNLEVFKDTA